VKLWKFFENLEKIGAKFGCLARKLTKLAQSQSAAPSGELSWSFSSVFNVLYPNSLSSAPLPLPLPVWLEPSD